MAASMCNVGFVRRQLFLLVKRKTDCRHLLGERSYSSTSEGEGVDHGDQAHQSPLFAEDDYFGVSIPEEQWSVPRLSALTKDELFKKYQSDTLSEVQKHNMHYVNMRFGKVRFDDIGLPEIQHHKDTRDKFHDLNQVSVKTDMLNRMKHKSDETGSNRSGQKYFVSFMDQFKKGSNDEETSVLHESVTTVQVKEHREQKVRREKVGSLREKIVMPTNAVQPRWSQTENMPPSHVEKRTKVEYGDSNLKFSRISNVNVETNNDINDDSCVGLNFIDQQYFQQDVVPTMPEDSTKLNLKTSSDNYSEQVTPELDPDLLFSDTDKETYLKRNKLFSDKEIRSSSLETAESESFLQTHPEHKSKTSKLKSLKTVDSTRTKKKHERFSDVEMLPPQLQTVSSPPDQVDPNHTPEFSLLETADSIKANSDDMNFIDQQFFGEQLTDEGISGKTSNREHLLNDQDSTSDLNFIDEEYFKEAVSISNRNPAHEKLENKQYFTSSSVNETRSRKKKKKDDENDMDNRFSHLMQGQVMDDLERDAVVERKRAVIERNENGTEGVLGTAYEAVQKLKLERNQATNLEGGAPLRDSKGMKIMKTTVPQLHKMTSIEIVHMITRHILYDSDDIVAIYKPYGLPSHGGPGIAVSVAQLKEQIGQNLSKKQDKLYMVHRLDKETTGVMLLARTQEMAARLSEAFRDRRVIKKYWVITKGIPNPPEGIIDIPMVEGSVDGKNRMALRPNFLPDGRIATKTSIKAFKAETYYKVKASHENTAIVECLPLTGIRHQLRAHLSFGLNTPILGDHKFSNLLKFAPQKLDSTTLRRLGVQQSKVRHIPLHLHAMSILIPEFLDGRNLFVTSNLPKHFCKSMRYLKLNPRQKS